MPLEKGVGFDLQITNEPYAFQVCPVLIYMQIKYASRLQIYVNGERFATFAHRSDPNDICGLQIQGDLELTGIQIA